MCRDADKVFSARKLSIDDIYIRYIACAGVFLTIDEEDEVLRYAEEALDSIDVNSDGMYLEPISTYHSILLF
jgi:hypothetical protein